MKEKEKWEGNYRAGLHLPEISKTITNHPFYTDLMQKGEIVELKEELAEYKEMFADLEKELDKKQVVIDSLTESMVKVLMATHKK